MDFKDCIKFANENRLTFFATNENDQPRVRPIGIWFADETGFYFQAMSVKAFNKQLQKNKKVEICFYDSGTDGDLGKVMRVSGEIEFLDDIVLKRKILEDRPF